MCPKRCGRRSKPPTLMMMPRGNGVNCARNAHRKKNSNRLAPSSAAGRENRRQLLGRNNFELGIGAVVRLFVHAPSAKLRSVSKAASLHVVVGDFDHQLASEWFPRQVLALAPAALAARHA